MKGKNQKTSSFFYFDLNLFHLATQLDLKSVEYF